MSRHERYEYRLVKMGRTSTGPPSLSGDGSCPASRFTIQDTFASPLGALRTHLHALAPPSFRRCWSLRRREALQHLSVHEHTREPQIPVVIPAETSSLADSTILVVRTNRVPTSMVGPHTSSPCDRNTGMEPHAANTRSRPITSSRLVVGPVPSGSLSSTHGSLPTQDREVKESCPSAT